MVGKDCPPYGSLMSAGKKEVGLHQQMVKAQDALS